MLQGNLYFQRVRRTSISGFLEYPIPKVLRYSSEGVSNHEVYPHPTLSTLVNVGFQAREAEEQKAKDAENPLRYSIETYALTASDVDAFIGHFGAMDTDRTGERDAVLYPHRYRVLS